MIEKLSVITTENTVPYRNLALEEYLLHHVEQGQCILYLWQNSRTVVIGRNQNAWKECRVSRLEEEEGHLARRISGGGAVFHDLGNLNFTFVAKKEDYDIEKQTDVILCAVKKLGIQAEKTGRNDITADGKKFSGNAYYQSGDSCFQHGTILLHVNKTDMSQYLNVSAEKLKSKSVESVKSRVTNLSEFLPSITVRMMQDTLIEAYEECYGGRAELIAKDSIDWVEVSDRERWFSSWEWKYGRKIPFDYCIEKRFPWGEIQIQIEVDQGCIAEIKIYSDALDTEFIQAAEACLWGKRYQADAAAQALNEVKVQNDLQSGMREDVIRLLVDSI